MKRAKLFGVVLLVLVLAVVTGTIVFYFIGGFQKKDVKIQEMLLGNAEDYEEFYGTKEEIRESWTVVCGTLHIITYSNLNSAEELTIPAEYEGEKVKNLSVIWSNGAVESNSDLKKVVIEEGVEECECCFAICDSLETVVVPASIRKLFKYEFDRSRDSVTLYVKKGSYGEKYAKKHRYRYRYGSPEDAGTDDGETGK